TRLQAHQLLLCAIVAQRSLGERTDENLEKLAIWLHGHQFTVFEPLDALAISSKAKSVLTRSGQPCASRSACFSAGSNGQSIASALTNVSAGAFMTLRQSAFRSRRAR